MRKKWITAGAVLSLAFLFSATGPGAASEFGDGKPKPLFEFELKGTNSEAEFEPLGEIEGTLMGSGEGRVSGRLEGAVRWSLYESSTARGCSMQFVGEIVTVDGVTIPFEGQGFAVVPDESEPSKWATSGAFLFQADDPRYAWLESALYPWEGETDLEVVEARLSFHTSRPE